MNHVSDIINLLDKEESRGYKIFANRITFENSDKKIVQLFDFIKNGEHDENDLALIKKLFGNENRNAFYRLKNRLKADLERSLLLHHTNLDEKVSVMNDLILYRICFYKSSYQQAYHYLLQAEKKAKAKNYYDVLNTIYDEMLVLCRFHNVINPNEVNQLQADNAHKYLLLQKTNALIATLNFQLRQSNYSGKDTEVLKEINRIQRTLSLTENQLQSPEIKFQIHDCVKNALLQKKDFESLQPYLIRCFNDFTKQKLFTKENHDRKIVLLIWIINSIFKNKKPHDTEKYLALLFNELNAFNKLHFEKYYGSYVFSKMYFFIYTNQLSKAIETLMAYELYNKNKKENQNSFAIYLNLCTLYFYKNDLSSAIKTMSKLFLKDTFQKLSDEWKLSISLLELMLQATAQEWQLVEHRILEIKRAFKNQLAEKSFAKEKDFIAILSKLSKEVFEERKAVTEKLMINFVKKYKSVELGSNDAIQHTLFIKSILTQKPYYSLLLKEIK